MIEGAVILAGGASRRMGRDKAWLEVQGEALLSRVTATLAQRCSWIVICAGPGQELPPCPVPLGVGLVRVDDPVVDAGPLVGLAAGLRRLEELGVTRAYVSSCDAAALAPAHVAFMLDGLALRESATAWVPVDADGRRHPLAAAVRVSPTLASIQRLLDDGQARLQLAVTGPGVEAVQAARLPAPEVLSPCNTPEQWRALAARVGR